MDTHDLDDYRGTAMRRSMAALLEDPKQLPADMHSATIVADVGMLVEPLNSAPYVFVLPKTVHEFKFEPGSGTDHLRQRMLAGLFFSGLVTNHERKVPADPSAPATHRVQATRRP